MLKLRKVRRYQVAKYPQGRYRLRRPHPAAALVRRGGVSLLLATILEACDGGIGTTGPPPVLPEFMTEWDVRQTVDELFRPHGVTLDVAEKVFHFPDVTVQLELDGYNDSLQVGYEYLADGESMASESRQAFAEAIDAGGPYVKILNKVRYESRDALEDTVEAFIDTLKARGVI